MSYVASWNVWKEISGSARPLIAFLDGVWREC